ncbi:MAG: hypothetical protein CM1200mP9_08080 [Gammaproteobacteria bacterium]|nr:MAG: hypothetical protein CM1200mP9_08080 [Gammaproteobacteria bacterium]
MSFLEIGRVFYWLSLAMLCLMWRYKDSNHFDRIHRVEDFDSTVG